MKRFLPRSLHARVIIFGDYASKISKKLSALGYDNILLYTDGYDEWMQSRGDIMALLGEQSGIYMQKPQIIHGAEVYLGKEDGTVDTQWFYEHYKSGTLKNIQLIDVRSKKAYDKGHLKGALSISWDSDDITIDSSKFPKDKLVILYCNTGMLSSDSYDSLDRDVSDGVLYLDAIVKCKDEKCEIRGKK